MLKTEIFPFDQIPFSLAHSQDIQSQNEKFQNSLISALHSGFCTLAVYRKKSLVSPRFRIP